MKLRRILCLTIVGAYTAGSAQVSQRWSPEHANAWYAKQPWLVGANYVPSDAINQFEMFQDATWNPQLNDKELGLAQSIGMNTVRVFLQDQLWTKNPRGFTQRIDEFLAIASKHGIRPILVLFDSCWDPHPKSGPQHPPIPGVHNSGWVQSPGSEELGDPEFRPKLEAYVRGVVGAFANDPRVLAWDIWNEPDNPSAHYPPEDMPKDHKTALVNKLLPQAFQWARAEHPIQPLTSAMWVGDWSHPDRESGTVKIQLAESDVLSFHNYQWPEGFEKRIRELSSYGRPILCTEYMARGSGSTFDGDLPIAKRYNVAVINWGLVAGKTQTYLPWDSWHHPYVLDEPTVWFHDVFRPDDKPYRQHEADLIRELTGGETSLKTVSGNRESLRSPH